MSRHWIAPLLLLGLRRPLTSHSFDGQRKGFVLGGGGGYSPYIHWSRNVDNVSQNLTGPNIQIIIGYGWNNANTLVYQAPPNFASSDELQQNIFQGVWAVRWYHYFRVQENKFAVRGKKWYSMVGVGRSVFNAGCNLSTSIRAVGWGFVAGVGYEFIPHLQAGVTFMAGWGSDEGYDYSHQTLALTLTALAY